MMTVKFLGDVHLGRRFIHGVPLHRRGEREESQFKKFLASLRDVQPGDTHVCVGDLFDKAVVPFSVILDTAEAYLKAAHANPEVAFVVIAGNHDLSRDADRKSAFQVFQKLLEDVRNIFVLTEPMKFGEVVCYPWHPFKTAAEIVEETPLTGEIAVGHWDVDSFGNDSNLIPTQILAEKGFKKAVTGHVHLPGTFTRDGIEVTVTGSMEPYSHAEDPDGQIYVTRTLAEVKANPDAFKDKCLRVRLQPGETLDEEIDCLALTVQRVGVDDEETTTVSLGDFDLHQLFVEAFEEAGVVPEIRELVLNRYNEMRDAS